MIRKRKLLGVVVASAIALAATLGAGGAVAATPINTANSAHEETESLLLGVLFATGPYADAIGINVHELGQQMPADYDEIAVRAVDAYYEANKVSADAAVAQIRSGDILTVKDGLAHLIEDFQPWVQDELARGDNDLAASGIATPQAAVCVWNVCAGNLALFINVAVAVAVWLVAYVIDDNQSRSARTAGEDQFLVRLTDAAAVQ